MAQRRNRWCRDCGAERSETVQISLSGLCGPCGIERQTASIVEVRERQGPHYDRWREGYARLMERQPLDTATG